MFHEFAHRQRPCTIRGEPERVILTRDKNSSVAARQYVHGGLFAPESIVKPGDTVRVDGLDPLIVLSLRPNTERDKTTVMVESNGTAIVQRLSKQYDANDNPIGEDFVQIAEAPGYLELVSGDMRQRDPGLLETTTHILQVPIDTDVPEGKDGVHPARVVFGDSKLQVSVVNRYKYPGALYVQLTEDNR